MAHRPPTPRRPGPPRVAGRASRRGVPPVALAAIVVLPALLVAVWIFTHSGAGEASTLTPEVASTATATPTAVTDVAATSLGADASTATPAAPAATEAGPVDLGIPAPEISAAAAVVVDGDSLEVLYDKNAHERRAPASLTKMATAIVAVEHRPLDDLVRSPVHYWDLALAGDSSTMGLITGDTLTLREMLYGLLMVSGNDAAIAIASHVSGSEEAFVDEMNALVERLGLQDTHFTDVDGLSDPDHYSSAWDLVILSRYLMRFPDLRTIVGTETYTATGTRNGKTASYNLYNTNPLLNYTPGVDGVKTGFTEEAGRTFSVTAERDGHRVYIVLLDTALRAQDSQALIEWAFEAHRWPDQAAEATETATSE